MSEPHFPRSVVSVTVLTPTAGGEARASELFVRGGKKRKGSKATRPFEKLVRRLVEGQMATAQSYLDRHNRSNAKRKNGWLKDMGENVFKAMKRGRQHLRDDGEADDV